MRIKTTRNQMKNTLLTMVLASVLLAGCWPFGDEQGASSQQTTEAVRENLIITTTEDGTVEAEEKVLITNELKWSVIIKSVVEEGKEAQLRLEEAQLAQEAELKWKEQEIKGKEKELQEHQDQMEELREDEQKLRVTAEKAGLVLYTPGWKGEGLRIMIKEGE